MAICDREGRPIAVEITSANPHEVTLVEQTLEAIFTEQLPDILIRDRAYDSDPLDSKMEEKGITFVAPHKSNRVKEATQDGRILRRYKRRWKVERLNAWLQNFRRVATRYEVKTENFRGFVQFAACILLGKIL